MKTTMQYYGTGRQDTVQHVAHAGTAGKISNGVGAQCYRVRVWCSTDAYVKIGDSPTATSSDMPMTAGIAETFTITRGQKVSAIQISSGGNLYVTELV
jgi:hypothetical protein